MTPLLLLLASIWLAPSPARAESSVPTGLAVSQDPLVEQIRRRQLTEPNGGVTAAVRLGDGKVLPLQLVNLDMQPLNGSLPKTSKGSLAPLKVHPGLMPKTASEMKGGKGKDIRAASEQLRHIKAKSWSESRGHRSAL